MKGISLKITVENLNGCIWVRNDTWHLFMCLSSTTIQRQDAIIHFQNATLDHDQAKHVFSNVKFTNYVFATIGIKINVFLIGFHIKLLIRTSQNHLEIIDSAYFFWTNIDDKYRSMLLPKRYIVRFSNWLQHDAGFSDGYRFRIDIRNKLDPSIWLCSFICFSKSRIGTLVDVVLILGYVDWGHCHLFFNKIL